MGSLYAAVRARLERTGLPLIENEAASELEVPGFGENGAWRLIAAVHEDPGVVALYSLTNDLVPEDRRDEMAQLLARINFGLLLGNFELDLDGGELRFKASLPTPEGRVDDAALDELVGFNLTTFDRYLPAIEAVRSGAPRT